MVTQSLVSLKEKGNLEQIHKERRRPREDTEDDGHVKMEAGLRVMLPQAKEHVGLPEAGGGKERSILTSKHCS